MAMTMRKKKETMTFNNSKPNFKKPKIKQLKNKHRTKNYYILPAIILKINARLQFCAFVCVCVCLFAFIFLETFHLRHHVNLFAQNKIRKYRHRFVCEYLSLSYYVLVYKIYRFCIFLFQKKKDKDTRTYTQNKKVFCHTNSDKYERQRDNPKQ